MRILAVSTSYPRHPGDHAGRFVHDLHAGLQAEGCSVTTLVPAAPGFIAEERDAAGRVLRLRYAPESRQDLFYGSGVAANAPRVRRPWAKLRAFLKAARRAAARLGDADLYVAHWTWPSAAALPAAGPPLLAVAHGADVRLLAEPLAGRVLAARIRKRVGGALCTSAFGASVLRSRLGLPETALQVRPMGVDLAAFQQPAAPPAGWPRGYLLGVGRLVREKGFHLLLEAAAGLGRPVVLAGSGPEATALRNQGVRLGLTVHCAGLLDRRGVAAALQGAGALVVPSLEQSSRRQEGCPVVAVEGLAAGVPVVAARTGGLRDLLPPGVLFTPGDAGDLRAALERVLEGRVSFPPPGPWLSREAAARDLLALAGRLLGSGCASKIPAAAGAGGGRGWWG